jgi:cell division protein FtsW
MGLFVCALLLTGLGLVCVYSFGGKHVLRQALWAILGVAASIAVSRVPPERLRRLTGPLAVATGLLLVAALLFAPSIEGTRRWIVIPHAGTLQPSELAKLAVVLLLADRLARRGACERGLLALTWPVLILGGLVVAAPDLGGAVFLGAVSAALLLLAGARVGRVLAVVAGALPVLLLVVAHHPYMQRRLEFFEGKMNYQQVQAMLALGNGGLLGQGLGAGRQKMHYLPAGHTDFVLPNLGEELGFLGVAFVGILFALIVVYGLRVAMAARQDPFAFHVACGATFVVAFQAVLNIAVATGAAPTKGISLPFLSQGGSNLVVSLLAIGLVVGVARSVEARRR